MTLNAFIVQQSVKRWDENWVTVSNGEGGGQGDVKVVIRKDGREADERFLKILRKQSDASRRQRMHREVAAYQTLQHRSIPKLIETNAYNFDDQDFKLYLVTEVVTGSTLGAYVSKHGPLALDDALSFAIALLEVVDHCHRSEVVHRDIKPDNIILRDDDPSDPVLVDFGLSFNCSDVAPSATVIAEEVGNRFLRLPELAPNSLEKRDTRSDVTFCSGVLLYTLTGCEPAVLTDGQDQMPHQVKATTEKLRALEDEWRVRQLRNLFDTAFQHALSRRWQSASELRDQLIRIQSGSPERPLTHEALREDVKTLQGSSTLKMRAMLTTLFESTLKEISSVMSAMERTEIATGLRPWQTGQNIKVDERWAVTSHCFALAGPQPDAHIQFRIDAIGSDLVVSATYAGSKTDLHRTPLDAPVFGEPFALAVEHMFLQQIRDELGRG
jgi:eukaryotic-like serine/threonine-protein kinase